MVRARRDPESVSSLAMGRSDGPALASAQRFRPGIGSMTKSDKACSLMEWNDNRRCSFAEVKEILLSADI